MIPREKCLIWAAEFVSIVGGEDGTDTQCWTGGYAISPEDLAVVIERAYSEGQHDEREACAKKLPDVLFDGFGVLQALDDKAKARTSAENVSDVLDAVVRLMRSNAALTGATPNGGASG